MVCSFAIVDCVQCCKCRCFRIPDSKGLSKMMMYICSLVSCPSQLSACGYQCYDHNISCKWLRALVCIQVRKPIIRHSLPSVKADNLFLEEDSFHLQPKFTLWRTYFLLTMKGALPYSIPGSWNARHSDIRMWNSEWQIQAYLFIKKPVYPSAGSHSSCFTLWSIC